MNSKNELTFYVRFSVTFDTGETWQGRAESFDALFEFLKGRHIVYIQSEMMSVSGTRAQLYSMNDKVCVDFIDVSKVSEVVSNA